MKSKSLNITFYNPNEKDELVKAMIKISAEIAMKSVQQRLIDNQELVENSCEERQAG